MKSLLVVGGDKLGNITDKLEQQGFKKVIHLNGRKSRMVQINIPRKVGVIWVLTDYVNHTARGKHPSTLEAICTKGFSNRY